jgi:uncharacterized membrane-anchored protein
MLTLLAGCSPFVYHSPEATAELRGAIDAANGARIDGPARVRLAGKTDLFVQTGLVYIPPAPAGRLLRALGERPTRELLGLLVCVTPERTDMAALYALEAGLRELPDIVVAGWRRAPELDSLRASAATAPGSAACGT